LVPFYLESVFLSPPQKLEIKIYKTIIFYLLLCMGVKLSLSHTKGRKVLENRVLRVIFGPKREDVVEGWRRLHNEELYNLYAPPNIIR
jgi:hypothetical protein